MAPPSKNTDDGDHLVVLSQELEDAALPEIPAGTVIDEQYEVLEFLGRGGMGIVLLARDISLDREVAIKLIAPHAIERTRNHELFRTEARAMAGVRHENVVQIYSFGQHEGWPYFAMEYVPGMSGSHWIHYRGPRSKEPASIDEVLGILDQCCRGLSAIHAKGIVHADIKPGNVLIGPAFRVALTDFGLVRALGSQDEDELVVGTPAFIAPEVVYTERPVFEPRTDVYALGVMAYEMLTGTLPFEIHDVGKLFEVHMRRMPLEPPSQRMPGVPEVFDEVLVRAMARDVDVRFETADAFRKGLYDAREALRTGGANRCIVLADDDEDFVELARETLAHAFPAARIVCAEDGRAALAAVEEHHAALAVIDLDMPGLNGIELTAAIRGNDSLAKMPIIVVTAIGGGSDWRLLQQLGADGFLVKPLDPYALIAAARRLLERQHVD